MNESDIMEQDERDFGFDAQAEMFEAYETFLHDNNLADSDKSYQLFIHGTDVKTEMTWPKSAR